MGNGIGGAVVAGLIAMVIGLIATWVVFAIYPGGDLSWTMWAVAFSTFFGAAATYMAGERSSTTHTTTRTTTR